MDALPRELGPRGSEHFTGLVCPDCSGSMVVQKIDDSLLFRCRVGHRYTVDEVLMAKEEEIERALWMATYRFEEMAAFLRGLEGYDVGGLDVSSAARARRIESATRQAGAIRTVIERDEPLIRADVEGHR